jgi:hypothetical protein
MTSPAPGSAPTQITDHGSDLAEAMASMSISAPARPTPRPLEVVNFLDCDDPAYIVALFEELLPGDRAPFAEYMAKRVLGVGIVTAVGHIPVAV